MKEGASERETNCYIHEGGESNNYLVAHVAAISFGARDRTRENIRGGKRDKTRWIVVSGLGR